MKKLLLVITSIVFFLTAPAQTINSSNNIYKKATFVIETKNRVIVISDISISISNFTNGGSETLYFNVDKTQNKDLGGLIGEQKVYYCTTKEDEPRKAIIYNTGVDGVF